MSSPPTETDQRIRQAAFAYVRARWAEAQRRGFLDKEQLRPGVFECDGKPFSLIHPQWGGYRPRTPMRMSHLLSLLSTRRGAIKYGTSVPKIPAQGESHSFDYFLIEGLSPDHFRNQYMHDAWEQQVPIFLFLETDPQSSSQSPCFVPTLAHIASWEPEKRRVKVRYGSIDISVTNLDVADNTLQRRYARAEHKQRVHQQKFRDNLKHAYRGRCAISNLSESELLEAAHIIPDHQGGQPKTSNGLLLSKIHHAAFDEDLIGITPDYFVKVSRRLLEQDSRQSDLLALLKKIDGKLIHLPRRKKDRPNQESLKKRYKIFQDKEKG